MAKVTKSMVEPVDKSTCSYSTFYLLINATYLIILNNNKL